VRNIDLVTEAVPEPVSGDHRVLAAVYRDKAVVLRRVALATTRDPEAAGDVVQEAFIRTLRARGAPSEPDELFFYLVRVVVNLTRSHAAKAARRSARRIPGRPTEVRDPSGDQASGEGGPMADAVGRLPRRQREVVFLRFWLDLTVEQTARTMGISAGAVKTHSSRAMDNLRELVEPRDLGEPGRPSRGDDHEH